MSNEKERNAKKTKVLWPQEKHISHALNFQRKKLFLTHFNPYSVSRIKLTLQAAFQYSQNGQIFANHPRSHSPMGIIRVKRENYVKFFCVANLSSQPNCTVSQITLFCCITMTSQHNTRATQRAHYKDTEIELIPPLQSSSCDPIAVNNSKTQKTHNMASFGSQT